MTGQITEYTWLQYRYNKFLKNLAESERRTEHRAYQDKANKKRTDLERDEAIRKMLNNEEIK